MALDDLLSRLEAGECVTPVTPGQGNEVTPKPLQLPAVTHVTSVTRTKIELQETTRAETGLQLTFEYFHGQGIEILAEDLAFLRWLLPRSAKTQYEAVGQYIAIWHAAMDTESRSHRKQNVGRFAANTWLRQKHDKHLEHPEL